MKKSSKFLAAIVAISFIAAGALFAADEAKPGKCCAKATSEGKTCSHPCCVEATKKGDNCTKCGGSGKISTKADAKK
ncbi:MAG: hypothetical protein V4773_03525 [Verrucomicrobiota bacterium]